jgi:hypothetical protein
MTKPMFNKSPEMKAAIEAIFPGTLAAVEACKCPLCKAPIGEFRDALSRKEYSISGLCQDCQDMIFYSPEE